MESQSSSVQQQGSVLSVHHLRNMVALQDSRSEGGRLAQAAIEADRRLAGMPEDVRAAVMARLNSPE